MWASATLLLHTDLPLTTVGLIKIIDKQVMNRILCPSTNKPRI